MKDNYFLAQVHQVFFSLAFINAIIFMITFMLSYKGIFILSIEVNTFHAISLIFLVFTPAFLGFLFTTFPRFLSTDIISKKDYLRVYSLFILSTILNIYGAFSNELIYKASIFTLLLALIYSFKLLYTLYKTSTMPDKHDTFYILIGFTFGILSLLILISDINYTLAINMAIYNFLFVVSFSVAQRMIPFFSHVMVSRNDNFLKYIVILLLTHSILEGYSLNYSFVIDFIIFILMTKEIYRYKLPFPHENAMISILHVALFWIPISFFISSITKALSLFNNNFFLALDIHTLVLGFLFTVLIGFGTRVTIGHSGNMMVATPYIKFLFVFTQIVVLSRILVSIVASLGYDFMIVFDISITLWLVLFILWLYKFFAVLVVGKKLK